MARWHAFEHGDFAMIYESYHPDAFFRAQFPDKESYVEYGKNSLSQNFKIRECLILKSEDSGSEARLIYYLDIQFQEQRLESFELAYFRKTEDGWKYYMTQKMERSLFSGKVSEIDWKDFETTGEPVFF